MFKSGDKIGVPCQVKPGPFEGEQLISFDTLNGPISGFVLNSEIMERGAKYYVRAVIDSINDDVLTVWVNGSFFNTNGVATISPETALAA